MEHQVEMSMRLAVLIVIHDMRREAPRTIFSALPGYQKDVEESDYEVIILENGSTEPLPPDYIASLPGNVRYLAVPDPAPSPVAAVNWGVTQTEATELLICIDGARIFSNRLIATGLAELRHHPDAFVYTPAYHLGPDVQMRSVEAGYDQSVEDALLANANWQLEPDNLFTISAMAGSSASAPFAPISESNAFFVGRQLFEQIGGYDPRFEMPGGSYCNLELFARYVTRPDALNIMLWGEGTFHQVHGGVATNNRLKPEDLSAEYERVMGRPFALPQYQTHLAGWPRRASFSLLLNTLDRLQRS